MNMTNVKKIIMSRPIERIICVLLCVLFLFVQTGCEKTNPRSGGYHIVCTVFPQYDWVMNILPEDMTTEHRVSCMTDGGIDMHSFQPAVKDLVNIATCDMIIYVGGESDVWLMDFLKANPNPGRKEICLLDVLKTEDRLLEEDSANVLHGESDEEEHGDEHDEAEYDEHVWMSVKNAQIITEVISRELQKSFPDDAAAIKDDTEKYLEKLVRLDASYAEAFNSDNTFIFCDRFPFLYMARDYDMKYYAAFLGCAAETELSFSKVIQLSEYADRYSVPCVYVVDDGNMKLAKTVLSNTKSPDRPIYSLNSMQSVVDASGADYIELMEENLLMLRKNMK